MRWPSRVRPSITGICKSVRIASTCCASKISSACSPCSAGTTVKTPVRVRARVRAGRTKSSSSTRSRVIATGREELMTRRNGRQPFDAARSPPADPGRILRSMGSLQERLQAVLPERYTIERELGRGGMATVYLAQDRKHHRSVALKVLSPELAAALGTDRGQLRAENLEGNRPVVF